MAWSEKAIRSALEAFWGCEIYPKYDWRSLTAMHSALNVAAAVDGDAQWNAAIEAAKKIARDKADELDENNGPIWHDGAACASWAIVAGIDALKRG